MASSRYQSQRSFQKKRYAACAASSMRNVVEPVVRGAARRGEARADPAVGEARGRGQVVLPREVLAEQIEREARRVPDLVEEVAVALDALGRERDALVARRVGREREAHRVGAERREPVAHRGRRRVGLLELRERLGLRRAGHRLVEHLGERRPLDEIERVDDVALHLAHLLAGLVDDEPVEQDAPERRLAHEVQAEHHHARDPEEEDVVAGLEIAGRVELLERVGGLGPAERRERPEGAREPGVEHVGVLRPARRPRVHSGGPLARDLDLAVRAVPRGDLVPPPELPRDAPVLDVLEEVVVGLPPLVGDDDGLARAHGLERHLGHRLHLEKPLRRDHRLDDAARALAARQGEHVRLDTAGEALLGERLLDGRAARPSGPCPAKRAGVGVHRPVEVRGC